MTTSASKRMRFAALSLSTALSVGVLAPFIGNDAASAACTTVTHANPHLKADQAKLKKAKKKLKKAKKHHQAAKVRHLKRQVRHLKGKVRADKAAPVRSTSCSTTNTPAGSANPLDLTGLLGQLGASSLPVSTLTDALNSLAAQVASSGAAVPGAQALADGLKAISSAITANQGSLSADEVQKLISELPADLTNGPAALQAALQDAVTGLTNAASNPPTTAQGVIDDVLNPVKAALGQFQSAAPLVTLVGSVQTGLDKVLTDLGLPGLGSLSSLDPTQVTSLLTGLSSLSPTQLTSLSSALPTDPTQLTSALSGLSALSPTQLTSLLGGLDASQLTSLLSGTPVTGLLQTLLTTLLGGTIPTF